MGGPGDDAEASIASYSTMARLAWTKAVATFDTS